MAIVNVHDAKSSLSRIPNHGKKVPWDVFKGQVEMADDFDAPLDEFKNYL
jgi:hypothetical protein